MFTDGKLGESSCLPCFDSLDIQYRQQPTRPLRLIRESDRVIVSREECQRRLTNSEAVVNRRVMQIYTPWNESKFFGREDSGGIHTLKDKLGLMIQHHEPVKRMHPLPDGYPTKSYRWNTWQRLHNLPNVELSFSSRICSKTTSIINVTIHAGVVIGKYYMPILA